MNNRSISLNLLSVGLDLPFCSTTASQVMNKHTHTHTHTHIHTHQICWSCMCMGPFFYRVMNNRSISLHRQWHSHTRACPGTGPGNPTQCPGNQYTESLYLTCARYGGPGLLLIISVSPEVLLRIYTATVRQYGAQVWDPHLVKDSIHLENVQKLALKDLYKKLGSELQCPVKYYWNTSSQRETAVPKTLHLLQYCKFYVFL